MSRAATPGVRIDRCIRRWAVPALSGLCSTLLYAGPPGPSPLLARGKQLARIECSQCHVVSPDQGFPPSLQVSAPSFEAIANYRGTSEHSLRHFISTTHWDGQTVPMTMPAPDLTKQETAAVVAYIMSLRKTGPR
jgi:mono/diheme cytochrome c family protein